MVIEKKKSRANGMSEQRDPVVLILRFIFGAIIGGFLVFVVVEIMTIWLQIPVPIATVLLVGGAFAILTAILAAIWGDRFLLCFIHIFKIFKYFP